MRFARLVLAFTFLVAAQAQSTNYTTGLAAALNSLGVTALATALAAAPASLFTALQQGNHTVFAPSNAALAGFTITDPNLIAATLAYHVTAAPIDPTSLNASDTFVRTALGTPPLVLLPNNLTQVLDVTKASNGTVFVKNAGNSFPVTANTTYQNLNIYVIDTVLQIPPNISTVATSTSDVSELVAAIQTAVPSLIPTITQTKGLTFFAPINSAIDAVSSILGQANATVITDVLLNHLINGTALYSSLISNGTTAVSAGGEPFSFTVNSTGVFVTSAGSTAKVVTPNILVANGVVHLIDTVLLNTQNNPAAASSAASAATATTATTSGAASQTGTVTPAPTSSSSASLNAVDFSQHVGVFAAVLMSVMFGAAVF